MQDRPDHDDRGFEDDPFRFSEDDVFRGGADEGEHAIPDDLVDDFLRETEPQSSDEESIREFFAFQRAVHALRRPVATPDHTQEILDAVARQRGWLTSRGRRRVVVGRYAAAGLLMGLCAGVLISQRMAPGSLSLVDRPTPMTDFVRSGTELRANAADTFDDIGQILGILPSQPGMSADGNWVEAPADMPGMSHSVTGRIARMTVSDPAELESITLNGLQPGITILHITRQAEATVMTAPPRISIVNPGIDSRYTWSGFLAPAADTHEDLLESISR